MAQERDGVFTWIHADHLSSATRITDAAGLEIRRLAYAAFGEEAENQGSGNDPKYKYTGKEQDSSGLYYYGARYYDPALSRFITADTVYDVGPQGLNRYSYALNNPIIYRDPTGNEATAAYAWETSYDVLPYFTTIDTGNNVADQTLASVAGVWNLGAYAVNGVVGIPAASYELVEKGYNWATEKTIGSKGLSGEGLSTDLLILDASGMPIGTLVQSVKQGASYLKLRVSTKFSMAGNLGKVKKLVGGLIGTADDVDDLAGVVDDLVDDGTAIVRRHDGHFSVEVEYGNKRLHTHQVITSSDGSRTQIMTAEQVFPGEVTGGPAPVQLPNAEAAMVQQQQLIQQGNLGPYNKITNSCVSHVCDVLNAGGIGTPVPSGSAQSKFLIKIIKEGSQ